LPGDAYGYHLILRVSDIERESLLDDTDSVAQCLASIVSSIGMRILAGPFSAYQASPEEKQGCSALVILYESHAAIHTYAHLREAFLDVFSCRVFDVENVTATLSAYLGYYRIAEKVMLQRGLHWSYDIEREMTRWLQAR